MPQHLDLTGVKVDSLAVKKLAAKVKSELDAELDRLEAAGEPELSELAQDRLAELGGLAALVQATK